MLPIHGTDHEETVPELLGNVCQVSSLRAYHASVVDQAVFKVCENSTQGIFKLQLLYP